MAITQANLSSVNNIKKYTNVSSGLVTQSISGGTTSDVSNFNGTGKTYRLHTFNSSSDFIFELDGVSERNPGKDLLQLNGHVSLAAGGGGVGGNAGGGIPGTGGSGGLVVRDEYYISSGTYPVVIGGAGWNATGTNARGGSGGNSTFNGLTSLGGGGGGGRDALAGGSGGSGGGAAEYNGATASGGAATQPGSASGGLGNAGGNSQTGGPYLGGGGGGATSAGSPGVNGLPWTHPSGVNISGSGATFGGQGQSGGAIIAYMLP